MVLSPEKIPKKNLEKIKAVKIHPVSKGLVMPTNPSTTKADTRGALYVTLLGSIYRDVYGESLLSFYF